MHLATQFRSGLAVAIAAVVTGPRLVAQDPAALTRALSEVQAAIVAAAADGPRSYYGRTYSKEEQSYWGKLPPWMQQDAVGRKVSRVLDIGCAYGTLLALATRIYGAAGYCWDITELNPPVQKQFAIEFRQGNAELDPVPWTTRFDVIIMTEVLEHFNFQSVPTLRKIRGALAADGVFFLSTPDSSEWGVRVKYYQHLSELPMPARGTATVDDHIWLYSLDELQGVMKEAGFSIARLDYSGSPRHFNVMLTPMK